MVGRILTRKRSSQAIGENRRNGNANTRMEINVAAVRSLRHSTLIGDCVAKRIHGIISKRYSSTSPAKTTFVNAGALTASPRTPIFIAGAGANPRNTGERQYQSFGGTRTDNLKRMETSNDNDTESPTNIPMHGERRSQAD